MKVKVVGDEGNINGEGVVNMEENGGMLFRVVEMGVKGVGIVGGMVGDGGFCGGFERVLWGYMWGEVCEEVRFIVCLWLVSGMFMVFGDLRGKGMGMIGGEGVGLGMMKGMGLWV